NEGATERVGGHRVGYIRTDPLWTQEIAESDLYLAHRFRVGDFGDGTVTEHRKRRRHADELARINVDPDTEHALLAARAERLARAGDRNDEVIGRMPRARDRVWVHRTEQHQFFADEVRRNCNAMVRQRDDKPLGRRR